MYDRGEVVEVNVTTHQVRVKFPARGDVVSPWLDVLVSSTHGAKEFRLPSPGNQVACLLDERGESGCVLGAVYSESDPVPSGAAADAWLFDLGSHTVGVKCQKVELASTLKVGDGASEVSRDDLVQAALTQLKNAISAATPGSADGGAAFQAALVLALSSWPPETKCTKITTD